MRRILSGTKSGKPKQGPAAVSASASPGPAHRKWPPGTRSRVRPARCRLPSTRGASTRARYCSESRRYGPCEAGTCTAATARYRLRSCRAARRQAISGENRGSLCRAPRADPTGGRANARRPGFPCSTPRKRFRATDSTAGCRRSAPDTRPLPAYSSRRNRPRGRREAVRPTAERRCP